MPVLLIQFYEKSGFLKFHFTLVVYELFTKEGHIEK
jgi:hypothetical protein